MVHYSNEALPYAYHYDLCSGKVYVPRIVKAALDGVPYGRPHKDRCEVIKRGSTCLYEIRNKSRFSKLQKILSNPQILDSVEV